MHDSRRQKTNRKKYMCTCTHKTKTYVKITVAWHGKKGDHRQFCNFIFTKITIIKTHLTMRIDTIASKREAADSDPPTNVTIDNTS